ncbi:hypothetical protein PM082_024364 [Marasmius tenuissimus]|nr:hypothetical protein PM082_024364 [Marasmius tenuissimus]
MAKGTSKPKGRKNSTVASMPPTQPSSTPEQHNTPEAPASTELSAGLSVLAKAAAPATEGDDDHLLSSDAELGSAGENKTQATTSLSDGDDNEVEPVTTGKAPAAHQIAKMNALQQKKMRTKLTNEKAKMNKKSTKNVAAKDVKQAPDSVVLVIPCPTGNAQRKKLKITAAFKDVLDAVYGTLGCQTYNCKPQLSWKLSSAAAKALATDLMDEDGWNMCVDTVKQQQEEKKESVPVDILVEKDYLYTLSQNKNKGLMSQHS